MEFWTEQKARFLGLDGFSRDQSNVSAETYEKLHRIVDGAIEADKRSGVDELGDFRDIAKIAVRELSPTELETIVADWLEGRGHLGAY
jgi:hypothetical protein